jgi:hypothetical protein
MHFDDDFKKALKNLPEPEKDKLLLRLLKKDLTLANRLYFELMEDADVDVRRARMEARVNEMVQRATDTYHSPGYLMMDLRYLSGEISEHVRVTRDKYGEVHLNLRMLALALSDNAERLGIATSGRLDKFCVYVVAKVFNMLVLMQKLHPDLHTDFSSDLQTIGERMGAHDFMMRTAMHHGLDVNWLLHGEVPDNIAEMQKDLRSRGYLK